MPRDSKGRPVLNKPFKGKSTPASKKYSVYVKVNNKKGYKTVHFGARGMDDWRSGKATKEQRKSFRAHIINAAKNTIGKATKEQRKSFRARMMGIKRKDGTYAYKDKTSPAYWSLNYLW